MMEHITYPTEKPVFVVKACVEYCGSAMQKIHLQGDTLEELYEEMAKYKTYNETSEDFVVRFEREILEVISSTMTDEANLEHTEAMEEFRNPKEPTPEEVEAVERNIRRVLEYMEKREIEYKKDGIW
jgi:organic radical activating enzyme